MTVAERFARARPRLLRLAYSELGDVGEAEDVVQEAWRRLERVDALRSQPPQDGPLARSQRVSSRRLREAGGWAPRMRSGTDIWAMITA